MVNQVADEDLEGDSRFPWPGIDSTAYLRPSETVATSKSKDGERTHAWEWQASKITVDSLEKSTQTLKKKRQHENPQDQDHRFENKKEENKPGQEMKLEEWTLGEVTLSPKTNSHGKTHTTGKLTPKLKIWA